MTDRIKPGRYRHYKGQEYEVYGVARHSETEEELVVYRCLYGDHSLWVRPLDMFSSMVGEGENRRPRFELTCPSGAEKAYKPAFVATPMTDSQDEKWMREALALARKAGDENEVPVGAVIVRDDQVLGRGWNCPIGACDPTAHAEIVALRQAAEKERNYRLPGAVLYVTIEPCAMCLGAIIHARVDKVVFAAREPKAGVLVSHPHLVGAAFFNHALRWEGGVCEVEATALIQAFFQARREAKKRLRGGETQ